MFSRLLVCLNGAPLNPQLNRRAVQAIKLMRELSAWFNPALADILPERLDKLLESLDGKQRSFY